MRETNHVLPTHFEGQNRHNGKVAQTFACVDCKATKNPGQHNDWLRDSLRQHASWPSQPTILVCRELLWANHGIDQENILAIYLVDCVRLQSFFWGVHLRHGRATFCVVDGGSMVAGVGGTSASVRQRSAGWRWSWVHEKERQKRRGERVLPWAQIVFSWHAFIKSGLLAGQGFWPTRIGKRERGRSSILLEFHLVLTINHLTI